MIPVMATFAEIVNEAEVRYIAERGITHPPSCTSFLNHLSAC